MKRGACIVLCWAAAVAAAEPSLGDAERASASWPVLIGTAATRKGPDPLDNAVAAAGGMGRFRRMETFSVEFQESVPGSTETVRTGRRMLRLHDGRLPRLREESRGPDGDVVVVVTSSGSWASRDGRPVVGSELDNRTGELLRESFLDLFPLVVRECGLPLNPLSQDGGQGRLMNRVAVGGAEPFPGGSDLMLYLDKNSGRVEGVSFGTPTRAVRLADFGENKSFMIFPARRTERIPAENRRSETILRNVKVNDYLDEGLFAPR
jgi:hypothetical protein